MCLSVDKHLHINKMSFTRHFLHRRLAHRSVDQIYERIHKEPTVLLVSSVLIGLN